MGLDYDLFVINPENKDTTPEQLRDCIYDALCELDKRTSGAGPLLQTHNKTPLDIDKGAFLRCMDIGGTPKGY